MTDPFLPLGTRWSGATGHGGSVESGFALVVAAVVGSWVWRFASRRGRGSTAVLRRMSRTPKEVIPPGARYFLCGFRTLEPGPVVASTGMARCWVSGHQLCVDAGLLGILRFDRTDTIVSIGRGVIAWHLALSDGEVAVRLFPSSWRSATRLLSIHSWMPDQTEDDGK